MIGSGGETWTPFRLFCFLLLASILGGSCGKLPKRLSLCEIQGPELESPYLNQEVITSGLVIADLRDLEQGGYILLDQSCPLSGEGSRGLYISLGKGSDLVDLGDEIRVQGIVREIGGETRLEASLAGLEILSLGNPQPDPVDLGEQLLPPLAFGYEKWEGQLVSIPQAGPITNQENSDRFRAAPRLKVEPSLQLVCFHEEGFSLEIREDLLSTGGGSLKDGQELEALIGLIRQDQSGYYLLLVEMPRILLAEEDHQVEGTNPVDLANFVESSPASPVTSTSTPSATPEPSPSFTLIPMPTIIPSPTIYPVRLLISELMPNPSGDEPGGEWIEIYNPSEGRLLLDGIKLGDAITPASKEGMLLFPNGYFINQGQALVIANQARIFESRYGFVPDFELIDSNSRVPDLLPYSGWGRSAIKLSNSGDEVLLVDPWDRIVDLVVYGESGAGGFSPPVEAPEEDHSLERYPPEVDRDQAGDWRERTSPSPGWLDRSPPTLAPTATAWASPSPTCSPSPEIITHTPVLGTISPTPSPSSTEMPPDTNTPEAARTPSSTPTVMITETPSSTPSETPGIAHSPTASSTCSPTTEASPTSTPTIGPATITPSGTQESTPSPTGTITPSLTSTIPPSLTPTQGPALIINEIHADPDPELGDSNGDGMVSSDDDEFLELVNISGDLIDLSGWQVYDEIRLRYTFPEGTFLKAGCGLVLFGGGEPTGDFGGSLIFTAGSLGLNNSGDTVRLLDQDGIEIDLVSYGSEGNQDQSLTRFPDLIGPLPLVPHSLVEGAGEALYSPGTRSDGSVFGSCP